MGTCQVNVIPLEEDVVRWVSADRIEYRACGKPAEWCLEERDGTEVMMCAAHQEEAQR